MKHLFSSRVRGFTLIELLVVVAIIALLTGIIMTNLSQSRGRARDAKRIADLGQIQLSLELFFDRCNQYPASPLAVTYQCPTVPSVYFSSYLSQLPKPSGEAGQTAYDYSTNSSRTDYFLRARLESTNEIVKDGLSDEPSWYSGSLVCGNAAGSKDYCVRPN